MLDQRSRPAPTGESRLDARVAELLNALGEPPGGAALVPEGTDSFAVRAATARTAGRSLDLQYYMWRGDVTGRLLALEVLRAADRGVKVRLLLDDVYALGMSGCW
jgi:putative cardiolipin synthase